MREGRRAANLLKVRDVAQDIADVLKECEAGQHVGARLCEQHVVGCHANEDGPSDGHGHGGPNAQEAVDPEVWYCRGATLLHATEQRGSHEVAGEHQKHDDAQVTAGKPYHVEVVEEHRDDGNCPKAVDAAYARRCLLGLALRVTLRAGAALATRVALLASATTAACLVALRAPAAIARASCVSFSAGTSAAPTLCAVVARLLRTPSLRCGCPTGCHGLPRL